MDHSAAGGDKCEFGAHGDTDLVRRKDPDASHHMGLIVPRSGLDHTGLVKSLPRRSVTWQGCRRQGKNVPAKSSAWLTPHGFAAIVMKAPEASSSLCPIRAAALPGSLIAWNVRKEQPQLQTGTFMETIPLVR